MPEFSQKKLFVLGAILLIAVTFLLFGSYFFPATHVIANVPYAGFYTSYKFGQINSGAFAIFTTLRFWGDDRFSLINPDGTAGDLVVRFPQEKIAGKAAIDDFFKEAGYSSEIISYIGPGTIKKYVKENKPVIILQKLTPNYG